MKIISLILILTICCPLLAQDDTAATQGNARDQAAVDQAINGWWTAALKNRDERLAWWRDARFGCFIHWGVYADPAGEFEGKRGGSYSEHIMRQLTIPLEIYKSKIVANFDPEQFNAEEWVNLIKNAGMKYVVITAKHHDGFAMWPSDVYKYDIRDNTKFKRDPMQELSDACHKAGVHFGFYYSHAFDWEHPDAPGNDWDYQNPGGDKKLFGGADWYNVHPEMVDRIKHYVDQKAIPQLRELIAKYHPDIFWFDTSGKLPPSEQLRIVQAVRAADPNVVINGRAARGLGHNFGDYVDTGDNPAEVRPTAGDWECIPTVNSSYGYNKFDNNYKTPQFFVRLLAKTAAKGGNMLLNIGPMGTGQIDPHATEILQGIGKWSAINIDSIRGTQRTPLDRQAWGDSTVKDDTIYLHVFDWPSDGKLVVGGLLSDVSSAYLLSDPQKAPLKTSRLNDKDVLVEVPAQAPDETDSVIVLKITGEIKAEPGRLLATNIPANHLLAFDNAKTDGKFTYGDGKAGRYYASGFSNAKSSMSWNLRTNQPATFDVSIVYTPTHAGEYQLKIGDQTLDGKIETADGRAAMQTAKLGQVTLQPGAMEMRISPTKVDGGDLMSLFEIVLTPAMK